MDAPGQKFAANDATLASPGERPRKRVLLVEDEGLTRILLLWRLSQAGLQVDFASNVPAGLQKFHLHLPDAVLMELPRKHDRGQPDLIQEARLNPQFASRPIYVYTRRVKEGSRGWRALTRLGTIPFSKFSIPLEIVADVIIADLTGPVVAPPGNKATPVHPDGPKRLPASEGASSPRPSPALAGGQPAGTPALPVGRGAPSPNVERGGPLPDKEPALAQTECRDSEGPARYEPPAADTAPRAPASADFCVGQAAADSPSAGTRLPAEACAPATLSAEVIDQALQEVCQEAATAEPGAMAAAEAAQWDAGIATTLPNAEMAPALGGAALVEEDYLPETSRTDPFAPSPVTSQASSSVDPMNMAYQVENAERPMSHVVQPPRSAAAPAASLPGPESCADAMVIIDRTGRIVAAKPLCALVFQREPAEVVGQPLEILLKAGTDGVRQRMAGAAPHGPGAQTDSPLFALARRKDGTDFPVTVTVQADPVGLKGCWALTFQELHQSLAAPLQSSGAQVAAPLALEHIPDIFHRAPAEPVGQPDAPTSVVVEAPSPAVRSDLTQPQPETVLALEDIPDIFHRAPAQPAGQPDAVEASGRAVGSDLTPPQPEAAAPALPASFAEQRARAESGELLRLAQRLAQATEELGRAQADLNQQADQLNSMTAAARQAEAARAEETARCAQLEEQLNQQADQLNAVTAAAQQVEAALAEEIARRAQLEEQQAQSAEELKRAQPALKQQADQLNAVTAAARQAEAARAEEIARCAQLEEQLKQQADQLNAATYAAQQAEGARAEEAARCAQLVEDLAQASEELERAQTDLRQQADQLNAMTAAAQQAEAALTGAARCTQLEEDLAQSAEELKRTQADLKRQAGQLNAATAAARQAEAAREKETARCAQLEGQLAQSAEDLKRAQADLKWQAGQLNASTAAARQAEGARAEAVARCAQLEEHLAEASEELERAQADLERQADQLNAVTAAARQAEAARAEETARCAQLEEQLALSPEELKRAQAELKRQAGQLNAATAAARQAEAALEKETARCAQLEKQLAQSAAELKRALPALKQQAGQLNALTAAAQQAEAALEKETARCAQLEGQLAQSAEELKRAQAELKRQAGQFNTATAATRRAEAALEKETARCAQLEGQLAQSAGELQRAQAKNPAAGAPEPVGSEAALQAQVLELETRLRTGVVSLARVTAEREAERGERQRLEQRATALAVQLEGLHEELKAHLESQRFERQHIAELGEQLRQREESLAQANTALQREAADRQLAEEHLRAVTELQQRLEPKPSQVEEACQAFLRSQQDVEKQLQSRLARVAEIEARLQQEAAERQRQALEALESQHREQMQERELVLARLQSALRLEECERKRLEAELLRSRYLASDSARTGRALANGLRRQMQSPVENLHQSARRLLQLDLPEDQKALVESMLEDALLLHTSLQETAENTSAPARPALSPAPSAPSGVGGERAS